MKEINLEYFTLLVCCFVPPQKPLRFINPKTIDRPESCILLFISLNAS